MFRLEVRSPVVPSVPDHALQKIPSDDIVALVDRLGLKEVRAARLALGAWALTDWVIMPKPMSEDRVASRAWLARVARKVSALRDELAGLSVDGSLMLGQVGTNLPREHDPEFNLIGLQRQLDKLSQAALGTRDRLPARKRGRPENGMTGIVMRHLARIT